MKRRHERVRLINLEVLVAEAGSASALARLANTSESYISQIRNQLRTPKGTPRGVGDELAARLEQGMGKPIGWMDEPHQQISESTEAVRYNAGSGPDVRTLHPLISWAQAGNWAEIAGSFDSGDAEDLLPCPIRCSHDSFVLRIRGESMEPRFREGDLIFVDPQIVPDSGNYVVVRLEGSPEATFRQLILEGERQYLKALNPDWPRRIIEVDSNSRFCGVVVFKGGPV